MRPISIEKRELIVSARERGEKIINIMQWYEVSESAVMTILRRFKETGSVSPKPYLGRPSKLTSEHEEAIHAKIKAEPDSTLEEIILALNLPIKKSQLNKWFHRHGYVYKKNSTSQQSAKIRCREKTSGMEDHAARDRF
jgi:transposase